MEKQEKNNNSIKYFDKITVRVTDLLKKTFTDLGRIKDKMSKAIETQNSQKWYAHIELPEEIVKNNTKLEDVLCFLNKENARYGGNILIITYIDPYWEKSFVLYGTWSEKYIQQYSWQTSFSSWKDWLKFSVNNEKEVLLRLQSIDAFINKKDFWKEEAISFKNTIQEIKKDGKWDEKVFTHLEWYIEDIILSDSAEYSNHRYIQKIIEYCIEGGIELLEIDAYSIGPKNKEGTYQKTCFTGKTDNFVVHHKEKERLIKQWYIVLAEWLNPNYWWGIKYILKGVIRL